MRSARKIPLPPASAVSTEGEEMDAIRLTPEQQARADKMMERVMRMNLDHAAMARELIYRQDEVHSLRDQLVAAMAACQDARSELAALEDRAQGMVAKNYELAAAVRQMRDALLVAADAGPPHVKHERIMGAINIADQALRVAGGK